MILQEEDIAGEEIDIPGMWSNGSSVSNLTKGIRLKKGFDKVVAEDINELRHHVEQALVPDPEVTSTYEANRIATGIFVAAVGSDGNFKHNPGGWTCGRNTETWQGRYHINHNFGTTNYTVQATAYTALNPTSEHMINVQEKSENRVIISIQHAGGGDRWDDFDIMFMLL
jgi:hypothetical protein